MDKPISVIIPCFNDGVYLREAIESLEECDAESFEVIIVNDGSTDRETVEILNTLSSTYTVIDQENGGLGAARNTGIRAARGKYVLPLDADNIVFPNYLTKGIELLDSDETLGVVYGKRKYFGSENPQHAQAGPFDPSRLVVGNYIDACAVIRKTALEDCGLFATDLPVQGLEDWNLWLTMVEKGWGFSFVNEFLYGYRLRGNSMSSVMLESQNNDRNLQHLFERHAVLIAKIFADQYRELQHRRSWLPYSIRKTVKKLLNGLK